MHAAILDDEKITEFETVRVENGSLAWLHKAAPAFPVDGSKVYIYIYISSASLALHLCIELQ